MGSMVFFTSMEEWMDERIDGVTNRCIDNWMDGLKEWLVMYSKKQVDYRHLYSTNGICHQIIISLPHCICFHLSMLVSV